MGLISKLRGNVSVGSIDTLQTNDLLVSNVKSVKTTLTSAQILALYTTEQTLVPAPGAGKLIVPIEVFGKLVFNGTAYAGSTVLEFRYTGKSGAKITADMAAGFLASSSGTNYRSVKAVVTDQTPVPNAPIVVFNPTSNPTAGASTVDLTVVYRVVTI